MKILFVINCFYTKGNGLDESARRTVSYLRKAGHDVRILSGRNPDIHGKQPEYMLEPLHVKGFIGDLIEEQGYVFAKPDKKVIEQAIEWADVVHLEEPFALERMVCKKACEMGKPCTCTCHLYPENLFASVGMMNNTLINETCMKLWKEGIFDKCRVIQAPSENTKNRLVQAGVTVPVRVISNGIVRKQFPKSDTSRVTPPYIILNTGRYSVEKDQMTLLDAMPYCKHAEEIQLIFAGKGPLEDKLRKKAEQLYNDHILTLYPSFVFLNSDELAEIEVNADLFVHCAVVEVEGMSCMEAVQSGLVPVIAESKYSAASEFTLNPQSRFEAGNAEELAERIDYWLEDKERREEESRKYPSFMKEYDISISIQKLEAMFQEALQ